MAYGARNMKTHTQKIFLVLYSIIGVILLLLTGLLAYQYTVFTSYVEDLHTLKEEYRLYMIDLQQYSQKMCMTTPIDEKKKTTGQHC